MASDELSEMIVQPALVTRWIGRTYRYVPRIGSTNDQLKQWLADSDRHPAGTVLLTDYQTAGRGRLDRRWEVPPATSLLFSVLLRPDWPAEQGGWLTMLAGVAVAEAIEAITGLKARLKWPNDIMIEQHDRWHKVAGLLLDAVLNEAGHLASAILGIGMNVNIPAEALPEAITPATSLLVARGQPVERLPLFLACLERLERQYDAADAGRSPWAAWNDRLITLGQMVTVSAAGTRVTFTGLAEATDEQGYLIVRDQTGRRHRLAAGDVTLRGN